MCVIDCVAVPSEVVRDESPSVDVDNALGVSVSPDVQSSPTVAVVGGDDGLDESEDHSTNESEDDDNSPTPSTKPLFKTSSTNRPIHRFTIRQRPKPIKSLVCAFSQSQEENSFHPENPQLLLLPNQRWNRLRPRSLHNGRDQQSKVCEMLITRTTVITRSAITSAC